MVRTEAAQIEDLAKREAAKLWAQQVSSSCRHELPDNGPATFRDFEILRACDARAKRYGLTLTSAFEEWSDAETTLKGGMILDAVRFYNAHHAGLPTKPFTDAADEFIAAKEAMGISFD